ncbi:MAG TPA: motility protein A [Candidatus Brocadiia bacterium]|nr:motility protein A [Candidatus Brocadiales bacterium]
MDLATLGGIALGGAFILVGIFLGGTGVGIFIDMPSVMITIGGSIAATLVRYPLKTMFGLIGIVKKTLLFKLPLPQEEIQRMVGYSKVARREGLLALEQKITNLKDPFLNKAVQLLIDGTGADALRDILDTEIDYLRQRHLTGKSVLESMGAVFPAFGMIGTLIGLIQMLRNLEDPSQIGAGMAVALITTFYGVVCANLICLPFAGKLDGRSQEEMLLKKMMTEGVIAIQGGDNPTIIQEKLVAFLSPKARVLKDEKK